MLYRFKSQASADMLMLAANAHPLLRIMGKAEAPTGIITAAQIPAAIQALEAAVQAAQDQLKAQKAQADEAQDQEAVEEALVGLPQRAAPLLKMLRESLAEGRDVIWGA